MDDPVSQPIIFTPDEPLESLKNRIVAALFSGKSDQIRLLLDQAVDTAKPPGLRETDEKYLRQILTALVRYKHRVDDHAALKKSALTLKRLLADKVRHADPGHMTYNRWEKQLDLAPWQFDCIFSEAVTFQMTSGCSNFCRRCNEWALPGVRGHFDLDAVNRFIDQFLACGNTDLALYGGSDPLDWHDGSHNITHVLQRLETTCQFSLLTKVPKGREELAKALVKKGVPISVSLTHRNRERLLNLERQMGQPLVKQHATADLLIPAGLDEDFATVKPSITDSYGTEISLDGCFAVIPAFTSALHPFGHKKIRITTRLPFIPGKKIGRPALLVDYFKPLEVMTEHGLTRLPVLLDLQVENIFLDNGRDELTPPGMRSIREYFDIFSDMARLKRKALIPSVVKRIKNRYRHSPHCHDRFTASRAAMENDIRNYIRFTKKQVVARAGTCSISFFLSAIYAYIQKPSAKCHILRHLTLHEYLQRKRRFQHPAPAPIAQGPDLLTPEHLNTDLWPLFRYYALTLLHEGPEAQVLRFIQTCPAAFHPEKDRFIPAQADKGARKR